MASLLFSYAGLRTVAALALAVGNARRGVSGHRLGLQAASDVVLALGVASYADLNLAQHLSGWLTLMMAFAIVWEAYAASLAFQEQGEVPGDPVSLPAIARGWFWIWETAAVVPPLFMGIIAADEATAGGAYLFPDDRLDALVAAAAGLGVFIWLARHAPTATRDVQALRALGVLLLLVAVWVLL